MAVSDISNDACPVNTAADDARKIVYWHRELPPIDAVVMTDHTIEANSRRVKGTLAHRDELWDRCYRELMTNAEMRIVQEVHRLGGRYAHVHGESISPKRDDAAGKAWLHGRFTYLLLHDPQESRERGENPTS